MSCGQARTSRKIFANTQFLGIEATQSRYESIPLYNGHTGENNMFKPCAHNTGHFRQLRGQGQSDVIRCISNFNRLAFLIFYKLIS